MFDIKKWFKIFWIIPIVIISSGYFYSSSVIDVPIKDLLISSILGQFEVGDRKAFVFVFQKLIYLVLFNILYGNFIYEDFRHSSVYLFSRLKNRKKWYYKKAFELLGISACYSVLFLVTNLVINLRKSTQGMNSDVIITLSILFGMLTMLLTVSTLLINLISLRFGNSIGFISVYIVILLLIFSILARDTSSNSLINYIFVILNPLSGVVINETESPIVQALILLYYMLLIFLCFVFGALYIKKLDISLVDCENN